MAEAVVTAREGRGTPDGPDLDEVVAEAASALGRMRDVRDALAALRVDGRTEDGDVRVTVDGSGALLDLRLEPSALTRPAAELGRVIVETAEEAAREAFARHGEIIRIHGVATEERSTGRGPTPDR